MLKKIIILLFIAIPFGISAQEKFAYINTQEVFALMPELKDIESKLATKQEEIRKVLAEIQSSFEAKQTEFRESKVEITETILLDRQKQLQDIEERFQTYAETSDKEFGELRQELLTPIQQKMQKAIQDVGAENGFTYIFELAAIPYVSTSAVDAGKLVKAKLGIN